MVQSKNTEIRTTGPTLENISYVREMLGQMRTVAEAEGCDMLCYLLEMAYLEASEIELGRRPRSIGES